MRKKYEEEIYPSQGLYFHTVRVGKFISNVTNNANNDGHIKLYIKYICIHTPKKTYTHIFLVLKQWNEKVCAGSFFLSFSFSTFPSLSANAYIVLSTRI